MNQPHLQIRVALLADHVAKGWMDGDMLGGGRHSWQASCCGDSRRCSTGSERGTAFRQY